MAIDAHAMKVVKAAYAGWECEDVSKKRGCGFDLHFRRGNDERRVEVKGTVGDGSSVSLTAMEVHNAREEPKGAVLAIVSGIVLELVDGKVEASGGVLRQLDPWRVDDHGALRPTEYSYRVFADLDPEPGE